MKNLSLPYFYDLLVNDGTMIREMKHRLDPKSKSICYGKIIDQEVIVVKTLSINRNTLNFIIPNPGRLHFDTCRVFDKMTLVFNTVGSPFSITSIVPPKEMFLVIGNNRISEVFPFDFYPLPCDCLVMKKKWSNDLYLLYRKLCKTRSLLASILVEKTMTCLMKRWAESELYMKKSCHCYTYFMNKHENRKGESNGLLRIPITCPLLQVTDEPFRFPFFQIVSLEMVFTNDLDPVKIESFLSLEIVTTLYSSLDDVDEIEQNVVKLFLTNITNSLPRLHLFPSRSLCFKIHESLVDNKSDRDWIGKVRVHWEFSGLPVHDPMPLEFLNRDYFGHLWFLYNLGMDFSKEKDNLEIRKPITPLFLKDTISTLLCGNECKLVITNSLERFDVYAYHLNILVSSKGMCINRFC